jgi:hypothetical protein
MHPGGVHEHGFGVVDSDVVSTKEVAEQLLDTQHPSGFKSGWSWNGPRLV